MFVWAPLPFGYRSSQAFAIDLLHKTGIVVVPGSAFGERGEGYVRMALVMDEETLRRAVELVGEKFTGGKNIVSA
ncbi:MAG TPA: aminotransferase class I/II-fold pyridoxal phosphate-dependent enzyme, partial [Clostridia bacterium]|nr:aminotransferase class I/II-fold pyridoxal phosphate-dependent enzyme [Clostridia bacterium]